MRRRTGLLAAAAVLAELAVPARAADDPLAHARQLYNQKQFEAAVAAAEQVHLNPARADAADLIAARAYLERYRTSEALDDLANARLRLRRIDPARFEPRERAEYLVGLGETLYFDAAYGAAADLFDSVLRSTDVIGTEPRERVLDWWAEAADRDARPRSDIDRQALYGRIRARMDEELAMRPGNAAAAYWHAAAARAQGDLQAAWDAAEAAWVRALLAPDGGVRLRDDIDRLMENGVIPDRAKITGQPPQRLQAEWDQFKDRWQK